MRAFKIENIYKSRACCQIWVDP